MPLMREWVEITVDEGLLIPVVQELLSLAANPNQVEVTYGTHGRVVLAEVHLADEWYRQRLKTAVVKEPEPLAPEPVKAPEPTVEVVAATSNVDVAAIAESNKVVAQSNIPVKPAKVVKPSASLKGEEL